ncbi:MAG: PIN domain-containing protein, partial [Spirochaetales bacterium]|nr:PIN domain-containing protein [Spirochaetales bacterium]
MTNESIILDTNALVFFITDTGGEKGSKVAAMICEKLCLTPVEVIAEAVYVLRDKYKYTRREISERLKDFIKLRDELVPETNVVLYGLNLYDSSKLDFVDCLL